MKLQHELRTNTYQPAAGDLVVSPVRAAAIAAVGAHYAALFGDDPKLAALRDTYALPVQTIKDAGRQHALSAFFFWTAWTCGWFVLGLKSGCSLASEPEPSRELIYVSSQQSEP